MYLMKTSVDIYNNVRLGAKYNEPQRIAFSGDLERG